MDLPVRDFVLLYACLRVAPGLCSFLAALAASQGRIASFNKRRRSTPSPITRWDKGKRACLLWADAIVRCGLFLPFSGYRRGGPLVPSTYVDVHTHDLGNGRLVVR
jgi:hypothetical protein